MEDAATPGPLVPALELVNTWFGHLAGGGDENLANPADLARWCRARGVEVSDEAVTDADVELARVVREGLRAALAPHNDSEQPEDAAARERLDEVSRSLELRVTLTPEPDLVAVRPGVHDALARVLAGPVLAGERAWSRLKVCRDPRCRTAFYDASRNCSGVWCSMAVCGAANKQRAFVERRRARSVAAREAG
jgi:predicted RNA-binding Zn ribbon-like protein